MDTAKVTIQKSGYRITQLDGWRGISILFVVVGHLVDRRYSAHPVASSMAGILSIWGVSIFFVISGFIITKLALREYQKTGRFSIRNFYTRRIFRIIPPFFCYLGIILVASAYSFIVQRYPETLVAALFACNLPSVQCGWFAGHTWTLAFEEQFYILFPLLFASFWRYAKEVFGTLFVTLVGILFVVRLGQFQSWIVVAGFASSFSFICIGAAAAAYESDLVVVSASRHSSYLSYAAVLVVVLLFFLDNASLFPEGNAIKYVRGPLNILIFPLCIAWLVASSVHKSNYFTRMLATPVLQFTGLISYSLYLWQQLFTAPLVFYIHDSIFLVSPLMFGAAAASYYLIERPSMQACKKLLANTATGNLRAYHPVLNATHSAPSQYLQPEIGSKSERTVSPSLVVAFSEDVSPRSVEEDRRPVGIMWPHVDGQHILHRGYKRAAGLRRDDPALSGDEV
jgi:peptidoglycan/LPS O-acetylase OafA/YrhL